MSISFTQQEFQYLQGLFNDMYQSSTLRDGPSGPLIVEIRNKLLVFGTVTFTEPERRFALFAVEDVFQSSHTPIVQPELGNAVRILGSLEYKTVSSISQINTPTTDEISITFNTIWDVMQSVMTKLGQAAPPPAPPLPAVGPTGDPFGISPGRPEVDPDDRMQ